MRRHAKASTAGSTRRPQVKGLGCFLRGIDAGRGEVQMLNGSGATASGKFVLSALLSVVLLFSAAFAARASAAAPTVQMTIVSAVTHSTAVLEGSINPEGEATTYHFEYGLAPCESNPCASIPAPAGNVGSGATATRILKEVKGLNPDTTYHFRVVAANGSGTTAGSDKTFNTYALPTLDTSCANQDRRAGISVALPDCRAYEMVSPIDKNGGDILGPFSIFGGSGTDQIDISLSQASTSGEKLTYSSFRAFGDARSGPYVNQYIATRGSSGWSTEAISPPHSGTPHWLTGSVSNDYLAFSPDLSSAWLRDVTDPILAPDAPEGYTNFYRRDNLTGSYEALSTAAPPHIEPELSLIFYFPLFYGYSADTEHSVFSASDTLTSDANPGENYQLYESGKGALHLVSVLPDGTPSTQNSTAGQPIFYELESQRLYNTASAISANGDRVYWTAVKGTHYWQEKGEFGSLYLRENPTQPQSNLVAGECTEPAKACTVAVSEGDEATFWLANSTGTRAFFTEGATSGQMDLYEFDANAEEAHVIAQKVRGIAGADQNASRLYFTSDEVLTGGEENSEGATAQPGEGNIYLYDAGVGFTYIASYADGEYKAGSVEPLGRVSRVTPDGASFVFMATQSLTGYDNADAKSGELDAEVYRWDVDSERLLCISCNPSKARPVGRSLTRQSNTLKPIKWTAGKIPGWQSTFYPRRAISDDGNRVFFESYDALLPRDTNGVLDVYQWEAPDSGGCGDEGSGFIKDLGGCLSLISSGKSPDPSRFVDASPDGSDIFLSTSETLVPQDPGLIDIYDARAGGGYAPPASPPLACEGDACQSPPAPPNDPTPASAALEGGGNASVHRKKIRHKKKNRHRRHGRTAHSNRGTGR